VPSSGAINLTDPLGCKSQFVPSADQPLVEHSYLKAANSLGQSFDSKSCHGWAMESLQVQTN
jgi:hypothetical protein